MSNRINDVELHRFGPEPDGSVPFYSTTLKSLDSVCLFQPSFDEFHANHCRELSFKGTYFPKEASPFSVTCRFFFEGDQAYWSIEHDQQLGVILPAHVLNTLKFEALRFRGLFEARLELRKRTRAAVDRFSERTIARARA